MKDKSYAYIYSAFEAFLRNVDPIRIYDSSHIDYKDAAIDDSIYQSKFSGLIKIASYLLLPMVGLSFIIDYCRMISY